MSLLPPSAVLAAPAAVVVAPPEDDIPTNQPPPEVLTSAKATDAVAIAAFEAAQQALILAGDTLTREQRVARCANIILCTHSAHCLEMGL